jgi:hypothetical protein
MSVYEEEYQAMQNRGGGGGSGDFAWFNPKKPSSMGQTSQSRIRVIQRFPLVDDGHGGKVADMQHPFPKFWVRIDQHFVDIDGQTSSFVCPGNHDDRNYKQAMTCPLCILQHELWKTKKAEYKGTADRIRASTKCYANVIDLEDPASHWQDNGAGGYIVHPKVWGYSYGVHNSLIAVCRNKGPIEDYAIGRDLIVEVKRIGKRDMDIRYNVIDMDPSQIHENLVPVIQGAWDLEGLAEVASMDDLRNAAVAVDPRVGSAPTPGAPTPGAWTPPPTSAPPPANPVPQPGPYTYAAPGGQQTHGLDVISVARLVVASGGPGPQQLVWADGWPSWFPVDQIPEVAQAIANAQPKPAAPPAPPRPPGADSYQPAGGYQVGGPPPGPPGAPPPAAPPPGPPAAPAPPPSAAPAPPSAAPPGPPAAPMPPGPPTGAAPPPGPPAAPAPPPAPGGGAPPPPPRPPGGPQF